MTSVNQFWLGPKGKNTAGTAWGQKLKIQPAGRHQYFWHPSTLFSNKDPILSRSVNYLREWTNFTSCKYFEVRGSSNSAPSALFGEFDVPLHVRWIWRCLFCWVCEVRVLPPPRQLTNFGLGGWRSPKHPAELGGRRNMKHDWRGTRCPITPTARQVLWSLLRHSPHSKPTYKGGGLRPPPQKR